MPDGRAEPMRVLGVIPARLQSTRLPRKVLRPLGGRPLVCVVYAAARRSPRLDDLLVATDSEEVIAACLEHDVPAVLTASDHPSGTDRVWEISVGRAADVYVNIQGDEPFVSAGHIERLLLPFVEQPDTQVTTLKIRATDAEIANPNVNKVVCDAFGRALYFSHHALPYNRDRQPGVAYYKHLGFYAYTKPALDIFHGTVPGVLERVERLEQLRFLERGVPITVVETDETTVGVDTEDDLRAAELRLQAARP